jgi:hypothetical protein
MLMFDALEREPEVGWDGARAGFPTIDSVSGDAKLAREVHLAQVQPAARLYNFGRRRRALCEGRRF